MNAYNFSAKRIVENDNSITLSLNEIDLIENAEDEAKAKQKLGNAILEYAFDYYKDYHLYSNAPNRSSHIPYVFKALIIDDPKEIGDMILCQDGRSFAHCIAYLSQ